MKIRALEREDIGQVVRMWEELDDPCEWNDSPEELWRKAEREDGLFLVAEVDGTVVGTAMGGYDGRRGTLGRLAVAASHRRKGIAEKMIKELERRLISNGAPSVSLLVWRHNASAIRLYRKLGYELVEGVRFMKKRLS